MDTLLIKKENPLHDSQGSGMQGRSLFRELGRDISDIVPNVAGDLEDMETYYGEINRGINQLLSDVRHVVRQANQCEADFVRELDREVRRAGHLRDVYYSQMSTPLYSSSVRCFT